MLTLYRDNVLSESEVLESIPRLKSRVDMSSFTLNNLLYWAQTQMSGFHANPVEVDLKKRAQMTCSFFNEDIENKNISLNCEIPVGYKARFDVNHLDVILRNLVSNAIKFTPEGGEIQFRITELDNRIAFEVINEGVSIPTEVIQALEDDQTYSSSPGTRQEKGTGVGLKIAKELTELNGGEFELVTPGVDGTTVRIYLPKVSPLKAVV
jgi:signal transduction histidine kinase